MVTELSTNDLPSSFDWREKGAVNPIYNQLAPFKCASSSWAFSATTSMEGAHFIKSGYLPSLSNQQLVDCVKTANGCYGGTVS